VPYFSYRGRDARGAAVTGTLEGQDSGAIADQLMRTGITPVDITLNTRAAPLEAPDWFAALTAPAVTDVDLMLFSRQMYSLLKAGVPILRALAGLQESTSNRTMKTIIADLRVSLDSGRELSAAMRRHPKVFSGFYVNVVRVGEATGKLDEVFQRLFFYLEFEKEIRDRIKSALRYPTIVLVVMAIAIAIVNFAVIPVFARIFATYKVPLPFLTQVLIGTSNFFLAYWHAMAVGIAATLSGIFWYIRTPLGRYAWDRLKLRLPIAGPIIVKATLARFARSLGLATQAGVPIVQGLSVVAETVDNAFMAGRLEQMRDGVERGETILRTATVAGVFTPVVLQMVAVGEETGSLDDQMFEVADMYEREIDYEIKNLSAQLEPILTIFLGVLVAILALGVFLPIWDLGSVMLKK